MLTDSRYVYVEGDTASETRVRPHNWAERFAGTAASYGADRRLRYSAVIEPVVVNGTKCLRMCRSLEQSNPVLFSEVLGFADYYGLRVHGMARDVELLAQAS